MNRISVIAPVVLTEAVSPANQWRQSVNVNSLLRTRVMLQSFFKRFDQSAVEQFMIVCPARDQAAIQQVAKQLDPASVVTVVDEAEFFRTCGFGDIESAGLSNWKLQQIIKLGFAKICATDVYLTMDSDIVQFRQADASDLFAADGKALIGVETAADYDRIYSADFSAKEQQAKQLYYEASQSILGYHRPTNWSGVFYSETPVMLNRVAVLKMLEHIEKQHDSGIVAVLSEYKEWTEYSLYFQFLEMTDGLSDLYTSGGCNALLSLEKSIWQPTVCYKSQRFYDRHHFVDSLPVREGPFVAIQSWIPSEEWLPLKFRKLADFYEHLEVWLDSAEDSQTMEEDAPGTALERVNPEAFLRILQSVDPASALYRRSREVLGKVLEVGPAIPQATRKGDPKFLTIGMTTHNDYDGCYFTLQAIRLYHPEILNDVEFLLVDNDPAGPCANSLKALENFIPNYRYLPHVSRRGTAVRDLIFREASGEFVLCIDCHVFFPAGALARLIEYCRAHPDSKDLLQGPLISDALEPMATHFEPKWSHGMYGEWAMDNRGESIDAAPFEIDMQGLGVFACRRRHWPGFNPRLAGFGGEEGYLHEKIRRAGGRNLCLPFLRWMHRFERPLGVPYEPSWGDRIRNYLLVFDELKLDPAPVVEHFEGLLGTEATRNLIEPAQAELAGPFHAFDSIYCINLDRQRERWSAMQRRFRKLGIERAVRRFSAAETPFNHHIGCALSHRRIIAEAKQQQLETILVFEDDARFSHDACAVLARSLRSLLGRDWQLLYLGGYRSVSSLEEVPGCENLLVPGVISCTHAIAYHHSVYDAILSQVPDNAVDIALWLRTHKAIDKFYNLSLGAQAYLVWPVIATQSIILAEEVRDFDD